MEGRIDTSDHLDNNSDKCVVSCHTLHVGSIPPTRPSLLLGYNSNNSNNNNSSSSKNLARHCETDDLNYSVEMTLREFQQFLEEGQCWYGSQNQNNTTRQSDCAQQQPIGSRNRNRTIMFDPCNALGAEVSLGDFLLHNHNNIDIKVHDAILSEEIQVTDNRRSAVLVIMQRQNQREQERWDDEFDSSLEVQPIHTFDDLMPPNLMNASFDMHTGDGDDEATVDMNESYSEDAFDDDNSHLHDFGGWMNDDEQDFIESPILSVPHLSTLNVPLLSPPQNSTTSDNVANVENSNTLECGRTTIQDNNDGGMKVNHLQPATMKPSVDDALQESCYDTEIISDIKDHGLIYNYGMIAADSIKDSVDSVSVTGIKNDSNDSMRLEVSTKDYGSNGGLGMCGSEHVIAARNFVTLLVLQILILAMSYYLRSLS